MAGARPKADVDRRSNDPGQDIEARQSLSARSVRAGRMGRADQTEELGTSRAQALARCTTLQSKAGYIDARPLTASSTKASCDARPDHTFGSASTKLHIEHNTSALALIADMRSDMPFRRSGPEPDVVTVKRLAWDT